MAIISDWTDKWVFMRSSSIEAMTSIPQVRKLVTAIPGPKSQEILKRRADAVSAALGMAIPMMSLNASVAESWSMSTATPSLIWALVLR